MVSQDSRLEEKGGDVPVVQQPWLLRLLRNVPKCLKQALIHGSIALAGGAALVTALIVVALLLFRFVDPPMTPLMLAQRLTGQSIEQRWVRLEQISPNLIRAVITSEDGQFCWHRGIDFREMALAMKNAEDDGLEDVRGASTISMQVAKNLFLWNSKDLIRKGLEIWVTLAMEVLWPKQRILEVYLNIAEWGPGVFGAEAAARHHFRKPAARLTEREAALLAASLPNPIARDAGQPGPGTRRLASIIEARTRSASARTACILGRMAAQ
jgi:monofunctional biosynthetic peptidoglycan transglycosylase